MTIPEILIARQRDFVKNTAMKCKADEGKRKLKRFQVGALPLIHGIVERMGLREILILTVSVGR